MNPKTITIVGLIVTVGLFIKMQHHRKKTLEQLDSEYQMLAMPNSVTVMDGDRLVGVCTYEQIDSLIIKDNE